MVRAPAQGWRRTMPLLSGTFTSTGRVLPPLDLPIIPLSSDARHDSARSLREESWENEGGHLAGAKPAIASSAISDSDVDPLQAQARAMEISLASDFANGRVGTRYNSYAPRSRVMRKQNIARASFRERVG